MKFAILTLILALGSSAYAKQIHGIEYYEVSGKDALQDQSINQYGDEQNPPQGYLVSLPKGYTLKAVDVVSNGNTVCGVSAYDYRKQTFKIDGFSLETDEQGCEIHLTILQDHTNRELKATYTIDQV